ncbi:MAG: Holliday junction branch migration protein RuvA [Desulfovibrionaceae bacterium]|nr:Holliday junction branch migration protein RuvA [Desulfovibrionaceae bacterium]
MIAFLEGQLDHVSDTSIIVITDGGVGYEVEITSRMRQGLPGRGGRVRLYTTLLVREDMLRLCGFETMEERETFNTLTAIPKVGPRLALSVLSVYRPVELRQIVSSGDVAALTAVSGIGKRLAEVIQRELSYKLKVDTAAAVSELGARDGSPSVLRQVLDGLKGLGYAESECAAMVQDILREQPDLDVASALRAALREIGRKK